MAQDPLRYYRTEARELVAGLTQGVLDLEKGSVGPDVLGKLLRLAHTLKGASRVVRQSAMADHAHALEDALSPYRDRPGAVDQADIEKALAIVDQIASALKAIDTPAPAATAPAVPSAAPVQESVDTVRVDVREMTALMDDLTETGSQVAGLRSTIDGLERTRQLSAMLMERLNRPRWRDGSGAVYGSSGAGEWVRLLAAAEELHASLNRTQREATSRLEKVQTRLQSVAESAQQMRLLPATQVIAALERAVRDAAQALNKQVRFEATGGETRLDAHILSSLTDALLHVVRNAVAHGIETGAQRQAHGKPAQGVVHIHFERRGNRVAFQCRDDGQGVDIEAVRAAAVKKGRLRADDAAKLNWDGVVQLLLNGGLSTSRAITDLSGRGIGLDVLRATAGSLKGEVKIQSQRGHGTTIEISVPISLASMSAITVSVGSIVASIPHDAVVKTFRLSPNDIARTAEQETLLFEGENVPYLPLARLLSRNGASPSGAAANSSALIVRSTAGKAAIGVDKVLSASNVVARALEPYVGADAIVAGVSLDLHGLPQLVLDPQGLVDAARAPRVAETAATAPQRRTILVIDDSLTTRMLEQTILESAGFTVDLAVSAEDGMEKARAKEYGLFLVDVEMPGMDGFEFVTRTRADPVLGRIPAILVSSRNAPEDLSRGRQAGASAYIVKGEFDQDHLLRTIRNLLG